MVTAFRTWGSVCWKEYRTILSGIGKLELEWIQKFNTEWPNGLNTKTKMDIWYQYSTKKMILFAEYFHQITQIYY